MKSINKSVGGSHRFSLLTLLIGVALVLSGCDTPTSVPPNEHLDANVEASESDLTKSTGVEKTPISGEIVLIGMEPPERIIITPSGRCHFFDLPIFTEFTGDVSGPATFNEQIHRRCDGGRVVASGPFEGKVTWEGRTGAISGQFTTNCEPDQTQPTGVSCDGVITARGSGGLEGVRFKYEWGPGWYPFPYSGTAFSN